MALFAGMSGWAYPEWRGAFYAPKEPSTGMLGTYSQHFNSVEINNTYYRMPSASALTGWAAQVPAPFQFAFKANQGITRTKDFASRGDLIARFCDLLADVGGHLGPVLFQLEARADPPQLSEFLALVRPRLKRVVMEFRHKTWFTDEVFDSLRSNDVALCQTETDKGTDPLISAIDFTYIRLRKSSYTLAELEQRIGGLQEMAESGHDVYCYLKHDVENAVLLRELHPRLGDQ
jgi:uncharacterized protein YecE (DUF72 family)